MEKFDHSEDKMRLEIVQEELEKFKKLIEGHKKLLEAIGRM